MSISFSTILKTEFLDLKPKSFIIGLASQLKYSVVLISSSKQRGYQRSMRKPFMRDVSQLAGCDKAAMMFVLCASQPIDSVRKITQNRIDPILQPSSPSDVFLSMFRRASKLFSDLSIKFFFNLSFLNDANLSLRGRP